MTEVLIIDDDKEIHAMLKLALDQIGMHTVSAFSGEEGFKRLQQYHSDIVLLDINLPGKSGLQILKAIRVNPETKNCTVVMLTVMRDRQTLTECAKAGISDYIAKPFELPRLIAKLSMISRNLVIERELMKTKGITRIQMDRSGGIVTLMIIGSVTPTTVDHLRNLYTPAFTLLTKRDAIIINVRGLPDISEAENSLLQQMCMILAPRQPYFVAGRNYGRLLPVVPDFETRLFIIEEDAIAFIRSQSSGIDSTPKGRE